MHYLTVDNGSICYKEFSNQIEEDELSMDTSLCNADQDLNESHINKWYEEKCKMLVPRVDLHEFNNVVVLYKGEYFPGVVTLIHPQGTGARVKAMQP